MTVDTHVDIYDSTIAIDGTTINGIFPESIPFPKGKTGTKDTSTLGSGKVQKKGLKSFDPGACTLTGNKIPGDAGQIALWNAFKDRKEHTFTITIPDAGEVYTYNAYVSTNYPDQKDETYTFSVDLEVSGWPSLATTYAAITSIEGAGAGIAYSPATANTALVSTDNEIIFKEATGVASDTIEVTAAAASYIGVSYDGGTNWTTLTSGVASAIPSTAYPAAGKLTKAIVRVEEALKATRFVTVLIARA